jgi:PAS domain S-box-containing protein
MTDDPQSSRRQSAPPTPAGAGLVPDLSFAQFRALANSMPNLAWMADEDGWLIWYNDRWYEYTGTTPDQMVGWGWQSVHHPDVLPEMLRRWTTALKSGEAFEMTFPLRRGSDGSYRMFMTRAEPLRENGRIVGWLGTNTDITETERTTERLQLVINELNHRVKNTLATVLSIAQNTFRNIDTETYEKFEERLLALSLVHDALTREGWSTAQIRELVEGVLKTFDLNRFIVEGPDVSVKPRIASALAMTIHELCTNAAKYGSLSVPDGAVTVRWDTHAEGSRRWLELFWSESGGPLVTAPSRSGFGLKLITRSAATEIGAKVDHRFEPQGVTCAIRLPLDEGLIK